jgi:hypothetical protein
MSWANVKFKQEEAQFFLDEMHQDLIAVKASDVPDPLQRVKCLKPMFPLLTHSTSPLIGSPASTTISTVFWRPSGIFRM